MYRITQGLLAHSLRPGRSRNFQIQRDTQRHGESKPGAVHLSLTNARNRLTSDSRRILAAVPALERPAPHQPVAVVRVPQHLLGDRDERLDGRRLSRAGVALILQRAEDPGQRCDADARNGPSLAGQQFARRIGDILKIDARHRSGTEQVEVAEMTELGKEAVKVEHRLNVASRTGETTGRREGGDERVSMPDGLGLSSVCVRCLAVLPDGPVALDIEDLALTLENKQPGRDLVHEAAVMADHHDTDRKVK